MGSEDQREQQALLSDLKALGFTDYEARIYVALSQSEPSTAYEIANRAGVPRPNTYAALGGLAERGAVLPVSKRPVRYVAQRPDRLFDGIAARTRRLCNEVSERLEGLAVKPKDHYVWNLRGEAEIHRKVEEMLAAAESAIWIKADPPILRRHAAGLEEAAVARGVRVMIILFGEEPEEFRFTERCEVYIHEGSGVRMGVADNLFTLAIDHREMLTASLDHSMQAAHTENPAVVRMALSLIRHDYYMAEIFRRFKAEIDTAFGPHLRDLRRKSYTSEQLVSFREKTGLD